MAVDEKLLGALHVEQLKRSEVHAGHEPHQIFQASTLGTLLEANYDGEVSLADLAGQGDIGLGTFDAVDCELFVVDGRSMRAGVDCVLNDVAPAEKTPFAVVTFL